MQMLFRLFLALVLASACPLGGDARPRKPQPDKPAVHGATKRVVFHVLRVRPGEDIKQMLAVLAETEHIQAGCIVTCVGSLTNAVIRFADKPDGTPLSGKFEIVSLVGTVSTNGSHLHLAISDGEGKTLGGHMLDGCKVYTTAEIVVAAFPDLNFTREQDAASGYKELVVRSGAVSTRKSPRRQ